jgi:hypothetical protein
MEFDIIHLLWDFLRYLWDIIEPIVGIIGFIVLLGGCFKYLKKKPLSEKLELDLEWFKTQFDKNKSSNNFFFKKELYTGNNIDKSIKFALFDGNVLSDFKNDLNNFKNDLDGFENKTQQLSLLIDSNKKEQFLTITNEFITITNEMLIKLNKFINFLENKEFKQIKNSEIKEYIDKIIEPFEKYQEFSNTLFVSDKKDGGLLEKHHESISRFHNKLTYFIIFILDYYSKLSDVHIFGEAGSGKTYFATNLANSFIENEKPALFISGKRFTNDNSLEIQLKDILDIPQKYSFSEFLDYLNELAKTYNIRLPIIIDGLNEATNGIGMSNVWKIGLKSFIKDIKQRKSLLLITTCRETYKQYIWGNKRLENEELIQDFHGDVGLELIKKYFEYYKINAKKITDAVLYQFSKPLYLRIFCESKNHNRQVEIEVYIGEDSIHEIFDKYIKHTNENIIELLELDPSVNLVETALKEIGKYLWENKSRYMSLGDACQLIDNKHPYQLASKSKIRALHHEKLLIFIDTIDQKEKISFVYDLLGGYIIAKYLFDTYNNINNILNSNEILDYLFSNDYSKLHPLYDDIRRSLAILSVSKNNKYLHDVSNDENVITTSIYSLFEILPNKITENCVNFAKNYFLNSEFIPFNLLRNSLFVDNHPLNSMFFFDLLKVMEMTKRDLIWTENVRINAEKYCRDINTFEELCEGENQAKTIKLFAYYIIWCLSSVNKIIRDKATKALYSYGRNFPEEFFELLLKSLDINDPWISERMLAASYGVAMALQYTISKNILPKWGKRIYDLMFKKNAKYSTTHLLKRDYAKGIIDITLVHNPELLSKEEQKRITPPFKDGGIREWGESEDKDKEKYSDGNYPLDGIAHEDPISKVNSKIDKYAKFSINSKSSDKLAYEEIERKLFWRIYQLGYSLDLFGEIDKNIEAQKYYRPIKTYGYGKYVDIAVLELAGYRDDLDLFRTDYINENHSSLIDIDPSFPIDVEKFKLINKDFGVNGNIPDKKWLNGYDVDLEEYMIVSEINDLEGPWVLLDGFFDNKNKKRDIHLFPRGFFVHATDEEKICHFLEKQCLDRRWLPEISGDLYLYAGEIPWNGMFADEKWEEIFFIESYEIEEVPIKKRILVRNNEQLSEGEKTELYDYLSDKINLQSKKSSMDLENIIPDFKNVDFIFQLKDYEIIDSMNENDDYRIFGHINSKNSKKIVDDYLKDENIKRKIVTEKVKEQKPTYKKFEVLCTVRNNIWESYDTITPARNVSVPIKQIAKSLNLFNKPQTFDLYDKKGKASISIEYYEEFENHQHFTFLRKDLLDKFLIENHFKLIWAIWGNKEILDDEDGMPYIKEDNALKKIIKYNDINN